MVDVPHCGGDRVVSGCSGDQPVHLLAQTCDRPGARPAGCAAPSCASPRERSAAAGTGCGRPSGPRTAPPWRRSSCRAPAGRAVLSVIRTRRADLFAGGRSFRRTAPASLRWRRASPARTRRPRADSRACPCRCGAGRLAERTSGLYTAVDPAACGASVIRICCCRRGVVRQLAGGSLLSASNCLDRSSPTSVCSTRSWARCSSSGLDGSVTITSSRTALGVGR